MRISDWSSDVCSSDLVRFFGSGGVHTRADTATLRAVFERGALAVLAGDFARFTHELANGWHDLYASCVYELRTCVLLRIRIKRLLPKRLATYGGFAQKPPLTRISRKRAGLAAKRTAAGATLPGIN